MGTIQNPVISIITVVFNSKYLIQDTIKSVIQQSYSHLEFIVIDGDSTDGTIEIIREYDHCIDYWCSETDSGIYEAMNKGIKAANGAYLIFLNAGDMFSSENVVESVAKSVLENDYPEVLYGETNIFTEKGSFMKKLLPLRFSRWNLTLYGTRTVCHQSIFVRKDFAPFYDTAYELKGELCWYYDFFEKKPKLKAVLLPYPIANYSLGGVGDISFKKNIMERLKVVSKKEGVFGFVIAILSLSIPIVFRLKRILIK